ncbi:YheC/YheD family protein [Paenibacillus hamazuiensis]|uniref:YheC/YheD family endospore coat-associated protein n=1 Tax=Paenibacillus hamazuiensis TaxID=2936508 RepID=UPI00200F8A79|nr:YheC/YheD family protein [Paenibacillus hamazuiensis]
MKRTVGILLDHETFMGIRSRKTGYERIRFYEKAAGELNLKPFYMSLRKISGATASGYTYSSGKYRLVKRPIPGVIHNRAMVLAPYWSRKLKKLARSCIMFNRITRFGKYRIYRILSRSGSLRGYLPETMKYSGQNLKRAMRKFGDLYIKPTSGSVGDGVLKISRKESGRWEICGKKKKAIRRSAAKTALLIARYIGRKSYLIQEAIPLPQYRGRPYDLRVSVQRGGTGSWQVTGIVGKVAAKGRHVTNVAKGGKVRRCEQLFEASGLPVEETKSRVREASLEIAEYLGERLPHLADIGLDMAVDESGRIKFIEMNGRDQRITFGKAGLRTVFYSTYLTPLAYARYLMDNVKNKSGGPKND